MSIRNKETVFLVLVVTIVTFSIGYGLIKKSIIAKRGLFVVGVIESTSTNKSGTSVKVSYYYGDKIYKVHFNPGYDFDLTVGRNFFIKILPGKPTKYDYYNIDVPECLFKSDWKSGWKEIPDCP